MERQFETVDAPRATKTGASALSPTIGPTGADALSTLAIGAPQARPDNPMQYPRFQQQ